MTSHTYRSLDVEADLDAVGRILSLSFGMTPDEGREWVERVADHTRVLEEDGRIRGALSLYPMGHFFGGRSVPAHGVAGVGIDPAERGRGVGTRLMLDAVREVHEQGVALSSLYPAVHGVYRRAAYERAGHLYVTDIQLREIAPVDRSLPLRRGTADDERALEALERARAATHDGNVDRSDVFWRRTRQPAGKDTELHVVEEDGALTGYVRWRNLLVEGKLWLSVPDIVATTPGSARRLLAFLADHASQARKARCFRAPTEPLLAVADALCSEVKVGDVWMLRITHVENALTARGYPPGLTAVVHLDVEDDVCPANAGRWLLRVADGRGTVERGGDGRIGLHIRDLAPIYSGYQHPLVARTSRHITGSDADLATLGAVFAGGTPWMQDAF